MKRILIFVVSLYAGLCASADAHDRFLKLDSFHLQPNSKAAIQLFNGTFTTSEKPVGREWMADVSVIDPSGARMSPAASAWRDDAKMSTLDVETGSAGDYVVGLATKVKSIVLKADRFNHYLDHDGIPDVLAARQRDGELGKDARERYAHHAKALIQVGDAQTDSFKASLGHPVEIIPQQDPYGLKIGQAQQVLCVKNGKPIAGQFVTAGYERDGNVKAAPSARTDANGVASIVLDSPGKWFVKFIHMEKSGDPEFDYESRWATLTFEVR